MLQIIASDLSRRKQGSFEDLKSLKMCLQVLLNFALTQEPQHKIAGEILFETPIASLTNSLLMSQELIEVDLLEIVIELASELVKC